MVHVYKLKLARILCLFCWDSLNVHTYCVSTDNLKTNIEDPTASLKEEI